jgi:hypothetical protein
VAGSIRPSEIIIDGFDQIRVQALDEVGGTDLGILRLCREVPDVDDLLDGTAAD